MFPQEILLTLPSFFSVWNWSCKVLFQFQLDCSFIFQRIAIQNNGLYRDIRKIYSGLAPSTSYPQRFEGCLRNVKINDQRLKLAENMMTRPGCQVLINISCIYAKSRAVSKIILILTLDFFTQPIIIVTFSIPSSPNVRRRLTFRTFYFPENKYFEILFSFYKIRLSFFWIQVPNGCNSPKACPPNSICVREWDRHRCECKPGTYYFLF